MGIFGSILSTLGLGGDKGAAAAPASATPAAPAPSTSSTPPSAATTSPTASPPPVQASSAAAISPVDVLSKLDAMAHANPDKLNWKASIVDLLKLLGMDSSLAARKMLAAELGYPISQMEDSAQMNVWLHQTVLKKMAEHGGNIPPELLD